MMEITTQQQALKLAWAKHEDNLDRPVGLYGHDWGNHDWNVVLGGAIPSTITTLGARSRSGKSAFITEVITASPTIINGKRAEIMFFSWELGAAANIERYVCNEVGITMQQYRYAKLLHEGTKDRIQRAYSKAKNFPVTYQFASTNIEKVKEICEEWLVKIKGKEVEEGCTIQPIVVIDYVSMAQGNGKYGSKTYDIGNFMQQFKQFANVTGIAGLFLAQVLRGVEGEPNLNHLQDSSHFEQNSDNVVILWRPEADFIREIRDPVTDTMIDSRDRVLWRFLKTREGNPQDVLGHCDIQYFRFWHRHHQYGFNYNDLYKDEQFWRNEYGL